MIKIQMIYLKMMDDYILEKNDLDNTHASTRSTNSLPHACHVDLEKLKQLQR